MIQPGRKTPHELDTDQWKDILRQIASEGTMEITFTGGEVFLRKDLFEILDEARRLHFSIKLSTNGTLIGEKQADALADLKPWEIGVSLYGEDAGTHDAITKSAGSFRKTLHGIELMVSRGIRVKIRSVLMRENLGHEENLAALSEKLGTSFAQDPLLTPKSNGSHDNLVHRLNGSELRAALGVEAKRLFVVDSEQRWESRRQSKLIDNMCKAGVNFFSVNPLGKVLPCVQFQMVAGDLRSQRFHDIWRSAPIFIRLRKTINAHLEGCRDCRLLPICFRCPGEALLSDGDAFGPSSWACLRAGLLDELREESSTTEQHP